VDQGEGERADDHPATEPEQLIEHPVVPGQLGQVERQHRPREAGAEAEREGAGEHGPHGAIHRWKA
jgi:hypothetical protein